MNFFSLFACGPSVRVSVYVFHCSILLSVTEVYVISSFYTLLDLLSIFRLSLVCSDDVMHDGLAINCSPVFFL